jgi:hypothetical protein
MADLVDRLKGTLRKEARGEGLTADEIRILASDAEELAKKLGKIRAQYPDLPAAGLSPHLYRVLKDVTERYRVKRETPIRKASNF